MSPTISAAKIFARRRVGRIHFESCVVETIAKHRKMKKSLRAKLESSNHKSANKRQVGGGQLCAAALARAATQTDGAAVPSSSRLKSVACLLATSFSFAFCRNLQVCELVSLDAFSCCSFEQQPLGCCETRRAPIELERNEDEEDFVWLTYFRVNFFASAQTTTTTTRGATSSQPVAAADDFN